VPVAVEKLPLAMLRVPSSAVGDSGAVRLRRTDGGALLSSSRAFDSAARCIMSFHLTTGPIVSLIAGILILVIPRLLNYIVAIYLILIGLLGLGVFGVV
jgi:hypothetical protein